MATAQWNTLLHHIRKLAAGRRAAQRSDPQLLDDFSTHRDESAFASLVSRHGPMVLRVCRRVLNHEQDAEDAFQATFLVLARNCGSIRKRDALAEWLHGVAYRTAMNAKRSAARRRNHEAHRRSLTPETVPSPTWDDVQAVLDEEIQRLPKAFRAAFVLCVLDGKTKQEAAAELGVQPGTVSSRVTRARQRLQKQLARRGIELAVLLGALSIAEGGSKAAVPAKLASATLRLGLWVAAGETAARLIPAPVAALAAGVTRAMFLTKAKIATAVLFAVGLCATGTIELGRQALVAREREEPQAPKRKMARPAEFAKTGAAEAMHVRGRVLDPEGKPVAGARLYQTFWVELIGSHLPPAARLCGTSGPDGRFQITVSSAGLEKIPKAIPQIVAVADGFGLDWVRLDRPEVQEWTLRLVKDDQPITGRILDLEGRPIPGVMIRPSQVMASPEEDLTPWLQAIQQKQRPRHRQTLKKELFGFPHVIPGFSEKITTGPDGRFRLTGIGRERAVGIEIGGPKVRDESIMAVTRPMAKVQAYDNPSQDIQFTVYGATFDHVAAPAQPMFGTVRDKDTGEPLAGVKIDAGSSFPAMTDAEGKYRLESLPYDAEGGPSKFGIPVRATVPDDQLYLPGFQEVRPGPGLEAVRVDFELKRGIWAHGKVTNRATGKPVQAYIEYHVSADNPNRNDAPHLTRFPSILADIYPTRRDGTFRIPVLPGPGEIHARGPYGEYIAPTSIAINPGKDTGSVPYALTLDPGRTITGTILDPDGKPLTGVHVFNLSPRHFWTSEPLDTASFTLTALDPGSHRSLVFLHPDKRLVKALDLKGNVDSPLTVRLEPAGTVTAGSSTTREKPARASNYGSISCTRRMIRYRYTCSTASPPIATAVSVWRGWHRVSSTRLT
ncbi:MAG TPA: sigma-70 family RNA polymerase sigma factor [Gemmataceae bacterium]|nr:sigma-70 family RNA polymerase sigma factor [Gemmataceae bacterium]